MTASNGGVPRQINSTFFTVVQTPFPALENDKIDTIQFLDAAKGMAKLVDKFGTVFMPVRADIEGNIKKLTIKYEENPTSYKYVEDMIMIEQVDGKGLAEDALLWLTRGLHMFRHFFESVIADGQNTTHEELSLLLRRSYTVTLRKYHNWFSKQIFELICKMGPSRSQMFEIMSMNNVYVEADILKEIELFLVNLVVCVNKLIKFYDENTKFKV